MNKPLLQPPRRFQRLSSREWLLTAMVIGCAAGWVYERFENQPPPDVKAVMDGMKELKRNPEAHIRVTVNFQGKHPIVCDLSPLETPPLKSPVK